MNFSPSWTMGQPMKLFMHIFLGPSIIKTSKVLHFLVFDLWLKGCKTHWNQGIHFGHWLWINYEEHVTTEKKGVLEKRVRPVLAIKWLWFPF